MKQFGLLPLIILLFVNTPLFCENPTEPDMVLIEAGSFLMGSKSGSANQRPEHQVRISKDFYIGKYEVSRGEYALFCREVIKKMPRERGTSDPRQALVGIEWGDAVEYCNWLSRKLGYEECYSGIRIGVHCNFEADGFRLPTEAEWEYAAKRTDPETNAYYDKISAPGPEAVGSLPPDERGLYDMAGNSFEWCWDWYDADYYSRSPQSDPRGPEKAPRSYTPRGPEKVRRSGSWREPLESVMPTSRSYDNIYYAGDNGFRLVRTAPDRP